MNRTFTLKRLFINITVLCVVFALVRAFPEYALHTAPQIAALLPALFIVVLFAYLPPRHFINVVFAVLGSLFGVLFFWPYFLVAWNAPPTWWDVFLLGLSTVGMGASIGALTVGGLSWLFSLIIYYKSESNALDE